MNNRKAFTLVELIVVITILAILATIGFVSLQGYTQSAREGTRVSDMATIARSLEFFKIQHGFYPDPSNSFDVTYSGSLAWKQGTFGEETRKVAGRISEVPVDPLTQSEYSYSTINTRQEYELGGISESLISRAAGIGQAHAATSFYSNIRGNYNKQIVTVQDTDKIYILGVPTIITTEITNVTVQDVLANQSFAVKGSHNLPSSYANDLPVGETHTGAISFTPGALVGTTAPVIYEGNTTDLNPDSAKIALGDNLKNYYAASNISGKNEYASLVNTTTGETLPYVNTLIQGDIGGLPSEKITVNVVESSGSGGGGSGTGCVFGSTNIGECDFSI